MKNFLPCLISSSTKLLLSSSISPFKSIARTRSKFFRRPFTHVRASPALSFSRFYASINEQGPDCCFAGIRKCPNMHARLTACMFSRLALAWLVASHVQNRMTPTSHMSPMSMYLPVAIRMLFPTRSSVGFHVGTRVTVQERSPSSNQSNGHMNADNSAVVHKL
jgi:hypothetical protein